MGTEIFSLQGKVAIVTGASYGLGVVFARALADAGADVVVAARSVDKLEETKAMLEAKGRRALAVGCDITDREQVRNLMRSANDEFGRIDILVNNAGISSLDALCPEYEEEQLWRQII